MPLGIPGGSVEENELPREAALREAMEEVNQKIRIDKIIHEDSQFDSRKNAVFTRLVYEAKIMEQRESYWIQKSIQTLFGFLLWRT